MHCTPYFSIDAEVTARFPEIKIGVAVIRDIKVAPQHPALETLKAKVLSEVRQQLQDTPLAECPRVQAFRRIYRAFGVNPSSRRPSAEALLRRVLGPSKSLYQLNTVVDTYNLSSVLHRLPMAAYDLDHITPPVVLRFAHAGELHRAIDQDQAEPLTAGELIYADQCTVLCRDFNYRDSDLTKVTLDTHHLMVFVDGCEVIDNNELGTTLQGLTKRIITFNGGVIQGFGIYPPPRVGSV
jgi:DNA/RNA-binding domain of Phe-tRNA-synthetase-like protein